MTLGPNCDMQYSVTVVDNSNNLIKDGTCSPALSGDPMLDPAGLQDNGGPTKTIALLSGSPAINAGDDATCTADRPAGHDASPGRHTAT